MSACASSLAPAKSFRCSSSACWASMLAFSASWSWCAIFRSRSSVARSSAGQANRFKTKKSAKNTTQVHRKSPKFTSNGEANPSPPSAARARRVMVTPPAAGITRRA